MSIIQGSTLKSDRQSQLKCVDLSKLPVFDRLFEDDKMRNFKK